ncbi:DUF397 domain-containing protein [Streptomyces sp. ActVer]|uniref:DUF397 domain-containing protein n=1 Tax=Streptomyces sp. ActVer TaxID=3014558 RepID=UPI0022B2DE18|nr:DUF397 domain-containing protein [Streptomyces sp. ActVer]MCZ4509159.1 DUF397 domain-containing protein [Streptomyces sp. ActVer]
MRECDLSNARWRKSSYSGGSGGEDCVEVAYDFIGAARWRKSTYSDDNGGECLEVADGVPGVVPVRDSKSPDGPVLLVSAHAWCAFVGEVTRRCAG